MFRYIFADMRQYPNCEKCFGILGSSFLISQLPKMQSILSGEWGVLFTSLLTEHAQGGVHLTSSSHQPIDIEKNSPKESYQHLVIHYFINEPRNLI